MKNAFKCLILGMVCMVVFSCKEDSKPKETAKEGSLISDPVSYVNPFLGTAPLTDSEFIGYTPPKDWRVWAGLVFPGSSVPNAMVQLSPITEYHTGAGYEYEDTEILGFTHTNKGHWNLCNVPILPVSGDVKEPFQSKFSHDREAASPAYYEVFLSDYNVKVRLTSTLRCGIHEYTYENKTGRKVLFDLGRANNRVNAWDIKKTGQRELEGVQDMGRDKIYFFVRLDHDIVGLDVDKKEKAGGHALVHISDDDEGSITLKIGLSFVSSANAKENLEAEVGNKTFDEIHKKGVDEWMKLLSRIKIKGGTEKEKGLFYSSLYRSFLWPALRSDVNGQFTDEAGKTQTKKFQYYTLPSLWDTYRNKVVLLGMLRPKLTGDVIQSMINRGEIKGFMPTFFHGDHAASFVASSYLKGINNFGVQKAYELLLNNAYKEGGTRPYISEYIKKGYISDPDIKNPNVETKAKAGVSKTLEYAHDDYSLSLLAEKLGDTAHYEDLMKRSKNYKNVFDLKSHFMRGRLENGDWISPFDPQYPYYEYMYREANAWQVSFYVPHDMSGLVKLYGGKDKFEEKLDSLFSLPWNPNHIARNISSFIGQYCVGNQPDHEAPFSYYFVDKPEKSQKVIDTILHGFYGVGKDGLALPGMDDAGEMSAWYVFSASGLYPLSPADNDFLVTLPIFEDVQWDMPNGKQVNIRTDGNSRNLKSIQVDGKKSDGYFVPYALFKDGGNIDVQTK
ncbi:GH92 family glycosyl hydrolase [Flavobacteriaceae bacterium F89]|uniref:GH92 family glycosyl hydrolase n=1 Tax=Cerina litoralis TaxID=2874477 RepID=A0AAE3EWK5_9FLAO|nr:GH92 family glycosyl hydrolase [Cerina litoralis]MCG2461674.1 GH92 family glycosyl hydrolase [Cerina litoralis]